MPSALPVTALSAWHGVHRPIPVGAGFKPALDRPGWLSSDHALLAFFAGHGVHPLFSPPALLPVERAGLKPAPTRRRASRPRIRVHLRSPAFAKPASGGRRKVCG